MAGQCYLVRDERQNFYKCIHITSLPHFLVARLYLLFMLRLKLFFNFDKRKFCNFDFYGKIYVRFRFVIIVIQHDRIVCIHQNMLSMERAVGGRVHHYREA